MIHPGFLRQFIEAGLEVLLQRQGLTTTGVNSHVVGLCPHQPEMTEVTDFFIWMCFPTISDYMICV